MYTSANCLSFISLMSAPAAKAFSDPVRTTHRTESSVEKDRRAALSSWKRVELSAVCKVGGSESSQGGRERERRKGGRGRTVESLRAIEGDLGDALGWLRDEDRSVVGTRGGGRLEPDERFEAREAESSSTGAGGRAQAGTGCRQHGCCTGLELAGWLKELGKLEQTERSRWIAEARKSGAHAFTRNEYSEDNCDYKTLRIRSYTRPRLTHLSAPWQVLECGFKNEYLLQIFRPSRALPSPARSRTGGSPTALRLIRPK